MTVRRAATVVAALALLLVVVPTTSEAQDTSEPDLGNPVAGVSTLVNPGDEPAVVFIQMVFGNEPPGLCTGTLVDAEWVLTAAHCVKDIGGSYADELLLLIGSVDVQQDLISPGPGVERWEADGFVVNRDASIGNNDRWFDDLAMVHLPGQSAIAPMPLATDASLVEPPSRNATIATRFYGFGADQCGFGDSCQADGLLRYGESRIYSDERVSDLPIQPSPTSKELNRNFYLLPQPSIDGAGCFGDSGGPVTALVNGQRQVIGVNSFVLTPFDGFCEPFPAGNGGPSNPWYIHGAVDLVGTGLGNWVRSIMGASATCGGQAATIVGSNSNDVLVGTQDVNVMAGRGGPDLLLGRGANDVLCGGGGRDDLRGGFGNDFLFGNAGADDLRGQSGSDTIDGQKGSDDIEGGAGNDNITGGGGNDDLDAGGGSDVVDGGDGDDKLRGKRGADTLFGGAGNDNIGGGGGRDTVQGGAGADVIKGNAGDDDLQGNAGNDHIAGGGGDDTCRGGKGVDTLSSC